MGVVVLYSRIAEGRGDEVQGKKKKLETKLEELVMREEKKRRRSRKELEKEGLDKQNQ